MSQVSTLMKQVIGITGGIASGKSTVVQVLRDKGYPVIDSDQVVHDLQKKGGLLYKALVDFFGQTILLDNGELNRPKLSELIFSNATNRQISSNLQNDIIRKELARQKDDLLVRHDLVFMDIPLLFELGYEAWCDETWLIYVNPSTQIERAPQRPLGTHRVEDVALQRHRAELRAPLGRPFDVHHARSGLECWLFAPEREQIAVH